MENFNKFLRKFTLDKLLYYIGDESRKMFLEESPVKIVRYKVKNTTPGVHCVKTDLTYQLIWDMIDISYLAICSTNDYRGTDITENDMKEVILRYRHYDDKKSKSLNKIKNDDDIILYISYGHSQEEFKYQAIGLLREDISRNLEILKILSNLDNGINIDEILKKEIDMNLNEFMANLTALFLISLCNCDISNFEIPGKMKVNKYISEDKILRIIKMYSANYPEYKSSALKKHYLKLKPIVKTDRNKYIVMNAYLLFEKLADGAYWIIREYYRKCNSQEFINKFGEAYEKYIEKVFKTYLSESMHDKIKYEKLPETKYKSCDWKIETKEYIILIEQKSAIANLKTKEIYTDIVDVRKYLSRLSKGFIQLEETEKRLSTCKPVVKMLLHYENLEIPSSLEYEIRNILKNEGSFKNTFLVRTSEIERLIYLFVNNENDFNSVIERKLELSNDVLANQRSFMQIMEELNVGENDYILSKINHFQDILDTFDI